MLFSFQEEILDNSVLPYLDHIAIDQNIAVRVRSVQLLVDVIEGSDSQKVCDVLNIIEKVWLFYEIVVGFAGALMRKSS